MTATADANDDTAPRERRGHVLLGAELAAIYLGLPVLIATDVVPLHVLLALWLVGGICLLALLRDPGFDRHRLGGAVRPWVRPILLRFAVLAPVLALVTWTAAPELLLAFPRREPAWWTVVMLLYPPLSVVPQGVVYRVFFSHRYRPLLPSPRARVIGSAAVFAFTHVVFGNWVAPALTGAGGLLFASTYERSGSALAAAAEHALWGCFVITFGLGVFVFGRFRLGNAGSGGGRRVLITHHDGASDGYLVERWCLSPAASAVRCRGCGWAISSSPRLW